MRTIQRLLAGAMFGMGSAAAFGVEPTLVLPMGATPLTLDRLQGAYGDKIKKSTFLCSAPDSIEADGRKCERWSVEKVGLVIEFDYATYRARAKDGVFDHVELVKQGDCNAVVGAYLRLGQAVQLSKYGSVETGHSFDTLTYRPKFPSRQLKENTITLRLDESRSMLSYLFVGNR